MQSFHLLKEHLETFLRLEFSTSEHISNVCFINQNSELRDDFKISFSKNDMENYLRNINTIESSHLQSDDFIKDNKSKIFLPKTAKIFWTVANYISEY